MSDILRRISKESEVGNFDEALRWADRADRLSPGSEIINEILGRLFARVGDNRRALPRLRAAFALRQDPSIQAAIIDSLFEMRSVRQGFAALENALNRFAVTFGDPLALCARRHTLGAEFPAPGWVGISQDFSLVGEIRPNLPGGVRLLTSRFKTLSPVLEPIAGSDHPGWMFSTPVPKGHEGDLGAVAGSAVLIGSDAIFPPDVRADGRAEVVDGVLTGWAKLGWAPAVAPDLVLGRGDVDLHIFKSKVSLDQDGRHPFRVDLRPLGLAKGAIEVVIRLPDARRETLPDQPTLIDLPPTPLGVGRGPSPRAPKKGPSSETVDVIVPVYRGLEETMVCLRSVRENYEGVADLIVIDDASPEPELSEALKAMAGRGEITLLTNAANMGFAASVNWGLGIHPDRDCVVLNADAEVFPGWIGRLRRTAYSASDIGTVTPLTNSGTIASYPNGEGSPCTSEGGARIAELAAAANDGAAVEAPTGIGFCLYIRQDCRAATGLLDNDTFGRGYGEENDFCKRASRLGWRHLIAGDVYVRHLEGQSFGPSRAALMERNGRLLLRRHPDYDAEVQAFIKIDPLRPMRRRLDERRLIDGGAPYVLLVTLSLPGGVDRQIQSRRRAIRRFGAIPLVLQPSDDDSLLTLKTDNDTLRSLSYGRDEHGELVSILSDLEISKVEIHHFYGIDDAVLESLLASKHEVDIVIHDYSWICPRLSLLGGLNVYCGEPDVSACATCLKVHGTQLDEDLSAADLRTRSVRWLEAATRVIVPTLDVKRRYERYFPAVEFTVQPWEDEDFLTADQVEPSDTPLKVAMFGAIGEQKGFSVLKRCAEDAAARGLPIQFVVIGYTKDDDALQAIGNVFVTGRYEEREISDLIVREAPDLAFFSSVTPETWCFTLSHALRAQLPIAAFDIGAIAERVRAVNTLATLLPLETGAAGINDALLTLGGRSPVRQPEVEPAIPANGDPDAAGDHDHGQREIPDDRRLQTMPLQAPRREERAMSDAGINPKANVQLLPLYKGLYQFSVKSAAPKKPTGGISVVLPAVQISLAPGVSSDSVEYMTGLGTDGAWLFEADDVLIAKVKVDGAPILITSYSAKGLAPLQIEIERMDVDRTPRPAPQNESRNPLSGAGPPPTSVTNGAVLGANVRHTEDGRRILPTRIVAHISTRGDVSFVDQAWAGVLDQKRPIEGFMIEPLASLSPADIEYKGLTEKGIESPWVPGGSFCGTRQLNLALSGFSVRVRGPKAQQFDCIYRGLFLSGATVGPLANGAPLRAPDLRDYLQAIELTFVDAQPQTRPDALDLSRAPAAAASAAAPQPPARPPVATPQTIEGLADRPRAAPERPRRTGGPRFSVFRDEGE